MTFSALDGDYGASGDSRATMRLLFEMAGAPAFDGSEQEAGASNRNNDGPRRGYWRTYTPEGGGPFGREITEPYTEWVRPHTRTARTSSGAAP